MIFTCDYCKSEFQTGAQCVKCGAPKPEILRGLPYRHNDMIVYPLRDFSRDCFEFVFYRGLTMVGNVYISMAEAEALELGVDLTHIAAERLEFDE